MSGEEIGNFKSSSGIGINARLWIQVMIKRNQSRLIEVGFAASEHAWSIVPHHDFPIRTEAADSSTKGRNPIGVIFEEEQLLHRPASISVFSRSPGLCYS